MEIERITGRSLLSDSEFVHAEWGQFSSKKSLAARARSQARGRDVIFHGTRNPRRILADEKLKSASVGDQVVCFSRSADIAAHCLVHRDAGENCGAILILDRVALRSRFRLEPYHDTTWDTSRDHYDEAEERVWYRDIDQLQRFLVDVIWEIDDSGAEETEIPHDVAEAVLAERREFLDAWTAFCPDQATLTTMQERINPILQA